MSKEKQIDLVDKFRSELMDKFIDLCRGNDYNKLTLLKIGDTVDQIFDKQIKDILECEDGYRKQSEWISVKDGLPKPNTTVLGYNGEIEVYTYEGRYRWCTDSYVATTRGFKITHWMPIPELPKGE